MPVKVNFAALVFVKIPALLMVPATEVKVEFELLNILVNAVLAVIVKVPLIVPFGALTNVIPVAFAPVEPRVRELPASMAKSFPLPPAMAKVVAPVDCKLILVLDVKSILEMV